MRHRVVGRTEGRIGYLCDERVPAIFVHPSADEPSFRLRRILHALVIERPQLRGQHSSESSECIVLAAESHELD